MAFWDEWINSISRKIAVQVLDLATVQPIVRARAYRQGYQRDQLKLKPNQFDDNLALNYTGLIAARIVSQMVGAGFKLDFEGDEETEQERYIRAFLDANHQEILFHRAAMAAGEAGTGYLMILPDGVTGDDGRRYPRLQVLDPAFVRMDTMPEDYEVVIRYTVEYKFIDADGKEKARRRVIERDNEWTITDYILGNQGARWQLIGNSVWPWPFAPIIHWQNLPSVADVYGEPDITDNMIELQDRLNFIASNISKIIRLYAHPMRYGVNIGDMKMVDVGPDQMVRLSGQGSAINQLDPIGDLDASVAFLDGITKSMHNIARVVDLASYEDKLGSLTNFGLHILYQDNINMINTKRELFGDMLEDLISRVLTLAGYEPIPCKIVWPDFLPESEMEQVNASRSLIEMGLSSKQTQADALGLSWEQEQERIADERSSDDNLGSALLKAFEQNNQERRV